jgi:hypothetical protein
MGHGPKLKRPNLSKGASLLVGKSHPNKRLKALRVLVVSDFNNQHTPKNTPRRLMLLGFCNFEVR